MANKRIVPKISETEWEVMRVIWSRHPVTAAEIISELSAADPSWHPKTAKTLLARLVSKGALDYEPEGRAYVYAPKVSEAECVAVAGQSFLDRVFGGSLKPMLAHFVERTPLTPEEVKELEAILLKKRK